MSLKKRKDGTYNHHGIGPNQAQICFSNAGSIGMFEIYRPDGLYAKRVWTTRTKEAAEKYCQDNGWEFYR